jgi:hypothetical protein
MRGFPLGGPDKRLRIDFADSGEPGQAPTTASGEPFKPKTYSSEYRKDYDYDSSAPSYDDHHHPPSHHHAPPYASGYTPRPYREFKYILKKIILI